MIYYEEYGEKSNPTIVFLHGANYVQSFVKQYTLQERYHLVVPHITGYGKETASTYTTEKVLEDILELLKTFNNKVTLVGFSLGAQLAVVLASEHQELFNHVIAISPWIIKEEAFVNKMLKMNTTSYKMLKKRWGARFMGRTSGLNKAQADELAEYCQKLQEQTLINSVDNKIDIRDYPQFADVKIPVLALAGVKEPQIVKDSIKAMADMNPNCTQEVWKKAAHNIPIACAKQLTERLDRIMRQY